MNKKNVIIDLDGTLFDCNTFHKWMKFSFIEQLKHFDFIYPSKIGYYALLRLSKRIDHTKMKFLILKESEKITNKAYIHKFVDSISLYINKTVQTVLFDKNKTFILATAAPKLYSESIALKYGFDYVISTKDTSRKPWSENIREEKKKNVFLLLEENKLDTKIYELYTDHHDDLPLMKCSEYTYLVNANEKTKTIAKENNIEFIII